MAQGAGPSVDGLLAALEGGKAPDAGQVRSVLMELKRKELRLDQLQEELAADKADVSADLRERDKAGAILGGLKEEQDHLRQELEELREDLQVRETALEAREAALGPEAASGSDTDADDAEDGGPEAPASATAGAGAATGGPPAGKDGPKGPRRPPRAGAARHRRRRQTLWAVAALLVLLLVATVALARPDVISGVSTQAFSQDLQAAPSALAQYEANVPHRPDRWVAYKVTTVPDANGTPPPEGALLMIAVHRHVDAAVFNLHVDRGTSLSGRAEVTPGEKMYLLVANLETTPMRVRVVLEIHDRAFIDEPTNQGLIGLLLGLGMVPLLFLQRRNVAAP